MYEKLLALLQAKFEKARKDGLQQMARAMAIQVVDDTEAEALVGKIEEPQVTEFIKSWRKEVDSEVSKGTKSFEDNLKSKYDLVEKKSPTPAKTTDDQNDVASIVADAVAKAMAPLQAKIQGFESGRTAKNRKQVLTEKLKESPEVFKKTVLKNFERMNFADDTEFDTFVEEVVSDSAAVEQDLANSGLTVFPNPANSTSKKLGEKTVSSDITNWAKENSTNNEKN